MKRRKYKYIDKNFYQDPFRLRQLGGRITGPGLASWVVRTQAERVIRRFGGPKQLVDAINASGGKKNLSSIYRWQYPKEKGGTGGVIPTAAWPLILDAAKFAGIVLRQEDFDPMPRETKERIYE